MIINTGTPRSVKGHAVSGGIIALMLTSANEYLKYEHKKVDKKEVAKNIIKASAQGALITASGIAAANALGNGSKSGIRSGIEALAYVGVGIAGVYAINKLAESKLLK